VLHIEDNLSNLKLIERIVAQRPEVEVVAAMHGRLGLELARERHPALVLLDLHLPDMGGEVVLQELHNDPLTSSIPVVIVSADATSGQIHRLIDAGATAYLTKPIDVRELLAVLDEALGSPPNGASAP
jgi:CheY-like chemotaxis protein